MNDQYGLSELNVIRAQTPNGSDWEWHPPWPLPEHLREEPMVWQRAVFILAGTRLSDEFSVTQIVDIDYFWRSEAYRQTVWMALAESGFNATDGVIWVGTPMRSTGSEQRIADSIAYVQEHSQDEPLYANILR